jgi:uncharacterized protein
VAETDGIAAAQAFTRTGEDLARYVDSVSADFARVGGQASFADQRGPVNDSFTNFMLRLGLGAGNETFDGSTYSFNPISRVRTLLEFIHRGSWLGGVAVDLVADDMTKLGIEITSNFEHEEDQQVLSNVIDETDTWQALNDCIKWARLYGGSIGVIQIDGEDWQKPLNIERIGKGAFKGILPLDRWLVEPQFGPGRLVTDLGPDLGLPAYYKITGFAPVRQGTLVHHSRCVRFEGIRLPYWQRVMEQMWGISVLERLYDRMVAFDSATMGAAQLVQKSHLRTFKIKDLKDMVGAGGDAVMRVMRYVDMMRRFQGIEGMTLIDAEDDFAIETRSGFAGIPEALMQFGQQLAGALQMPLVRLFGMSPAGFSSTGESDLRTYYDNINQKQRNELRRPVNKVYRVVAAASGIRLGKDFRFNFLPLWQLTEEGKATVGSTTSTSILQAQVDGVLDRPQALREMRQLSKKTGFWSTITPEDIEQAESEPPPGFGEIGGQEQPPGLEGEKPEDLLAEPGEVEPGVGGVSPRETTEEEPPEPREDVSDAVGAPTSNKPPRPEIGEYSRGQRRRALVHLHLVRDDLNRLTADEVKEWLEMRGYSVTAPLPKVASE